MSARRAKSPEPSAPSLAHLLVIGGTAQEWDAFDEATWALRMGMVADVAAVAGAAWVTVRPNGGSLAGPPEVRTLVRDGITVVVDTETDGKARVARALAELAADGVAAEDVTEKVLAHALLHAPEEPDLAVVLGPNDRLPTSVSWELAYAELVFLDVGWGDLRAEHLSTAIDQYRHRDRRFGGIDT